MKNKEHILSKAVQDSIVLFPDLSEHLIRLHLIAYSAVAHPVLGPRVPVQVHFLYVNRLLEGKYLEQLLSVDPLDIIACSEGDVIDLLSFQIERFVKISRPNFSSSETYQELFEELSFTDPDAVVSMNNGASHSVKSGLLSIRSRVQLFEFHIDQFFRDNSYRWPSALLEHFTDSVQLNGGESVYSLTAGTGELIAAINNKHHEIDLWFTVHANGPCESFLCEMNLFAHGVKNVLVNSNHRFDEVPDDFRGRNDPELFDIVVGITGLTEIDILDDNFFRIASRQEKAEIADIELSVNLLKQNGRAFLLVPNDFFFNEEGRLFREYLVGSKLVETIIEISLPSSKGQISTPILMVLHKREVTCNNNELIFKRGDTIVAKDLAAVRENNPHLDLRPLRFLDSIEFEYKELFELFDHQHLNGKLRNDLIEILEALKGNRRYDNLFNSSRIILEAIYDSLISKYKPSPRRLFIDSSNRIRLENCWRYFSGMSVAQYTNDPKPVIPSRALFPPHIQATAKICQSFGNTNSHYHKGESSLSSFRSSAFALLDLLEWFRNEVAANPR